MIFSFFPLSLPLSLSRSFQCGSSSLVVSVCILYIGSTIFPSANCQRCQTRTGWRRLCCIRCGEEPDDDKPRCAQPANDDENDATANAFMKYRRSNVNWRWTYNGNQGVFVTQDVLFQSRAQQWNFDSLIVHSNRLRCYRMCRILRYLLCLSIMLSHRQRRHWFDCVYQNVNRMHHLRVIN